MEDRRIYSISGLMIEPKDGINPFGGFFVLMSQGSLSEGEIHGKLIDRWGDSRIDGCMNDSGLLAFDKSYSNMIWKYNFSKQGNVWIGEYKRESDEERAERVGIPIDLAKAYRTDGQILGGKAICQLLETDFLLPLNEGNDPIISIDEFVQSMISSGELVRA